MEKTAENIKQIAESVIDLEEASPDFNLEPFIQAYFKGEEYTPASYEERAIIPIIQEALWNQFERYKPSPKQAWEDNAPRIIIKIAGKEFQTFMDELGVQRFCGNSVITRMMDSTDSNTKFNLNTLVTEYYNGDYSPEDWLDFMTSFGYSVSGLMGWSEFQHLPVENPLWDEE